MGRKYGIKKISSEHEGELNDGTKVIDYSNDLYDLYQKAVVESLTKQKNADNYLTPYVEKSINGMLDKSRTDLGIKSLEKLEDLVKEATDPEPFHDPLFIFATIMKMRASCTLPHNAELPP